MSPASRRALLAALAVLVLAGSAAGTALAAGPDAPVADRQVGAVADRQDAPSVDRPIGPSDRGATLAAQSAPSAQQDGPTGAFAANGTVIEVTLRSNGDARWTITDRFNVSTAAERRAFESVAERFRDGESAQLGLAGFREARERVEPTVNRSMEISGVSRNASVDAGTLAVSFTWTNFARTDNETRFVDDAFTTPQGTWLGSIGPNTTLIVTPPAGSALDTPKQMTDGRLRWEGPARFEPGQMQITYTADPAQPIPAWALGLGLLLVALAIVGTAGGYLLTRRNGEFSLPDFPGGIRDGADGAGANADGATATESADDGGGAGTAAGGATGGGAAEAAGGGTDDAADDEGVDLSLLSDEERVEYLVEQNGGRMKQADIVKETGWSNAKVSQLLSSMEEEERIAKLRIGRENLISFPDEDIGDFEDG